MFISRIAVVASDSSLRSRRARNNDNITAHTGDHSCNWARAGCLAGQLRGLAARQKEMACSSAWLPPDSRRDCQVSESTLWWKEVINDVTNGLERRDEDDGKLEILRLVVGGNMATASLDTARVGEVDMGDELEGHEVLESTLSWPELVGDLN